MAGTTKPKAKRKSGWAKRLGLILTLLIGAVITLVATLPNWMGLAPVRAWLQEQVQAQAEPAGLEFAAISASWTGPIVLEGVTLRDPEGKAVVQAPRATWDRGLWQLLNDRPRYGTITLHAAQVDLKRREDGSIDLEQALAPLLWPDPEAPRNPETDATLVIENGSLILVSPELSEPLLADTLDLVLRTPAGDEPVSFEVKLTREDGQTLHLTGEQAREAPEGIAMKDLHMQVVGQAWQLALQHDGLTVGTAFDGEATLTCQKDHWSTSGEAALVNLDAHGAPLNGDRLQVDRIGGTWDLGQTASGWDLRAANLSSPFATLTANAELTDNGGTSQIQGQIDLADLARRLPHALHIREGLTLDRGIAELTVTLNRDRRGDHLDAQVALRDLAATRGGQTLQLDQPARIEVKATRDADQIRVSRAIARTGFLQAEASGDLTTGIKLSGLLDLAKADARLRQWIDLGDVRMAGNARFAADFRLQDVQQTGNQASPTYTAAFTSKVENLKLAGFSTSPIQRPMLQIEAAANGSLARSGLPGGWDQARIVLTGPNPDSSTEGLQDQVRVQITREEPAMRIDADIATSFPLGDRSTQIEASARAVWSETTVEVDQLNARLTPQGAEPIQLAAVGSWDRQEDRITLKPSPDPSLVSLVIPSEAGLILTGLTQGQEITLKGGLRGDLQAIDRAVATFTQGQPLGIAGRFEAKLADSPIATTGSAIALALVSPDFALTGNEGQSTTYGPVSLAAVVDYQRQADRLEISQASVALPMATVKAEATMTALSTARNTEVQGTIEPHWPNLTTWIRENVEPEAEILGQPGSFRLRGSLASSTTSSIWDALGAQAQIQLDAVNAFGVRLGTMAVVARLQGGQVNFQPIATTLNGGQVSLTPELIRDPDLGWIARITPGAQIRQAEIDDGLSRHVLTYIAPVLYEATQVQGYLSAIIDEATLPLGTSPWSKSARLQGRLAFQELTYGASPLVQQMAAYAGAQLPPLLKLNQAVRAALIDGRVHQSGLEIQAGGRVPIQLVGSVGLDSTLALRAEVPLTAQVVGIPDDPRLAKLIEGLRVSLPIGGTLSRPGFDRRAFQMALQQATEGLLQRGVQTGLGELLRQVAPEVARDGGEGSPPLTQQLLNRFLPPRRTSANDPQTPNPPR